VISYPFPETRTRARGRDPKPSPEGSTSPKHPKSSDKIVLLRSEYRILDPSEDWVPEDDRLSERVGVSQRFKWKGRRYQPKGKDLTPRGRCQQTPNLRRHRSVGDLSQACPLRPDSREAKGVLIEGGKRAPTEEREQKVTSGRGWMEGKETHRRKSLQTPKARLL
jgi:hypothetical protein